MAKLSYKFSYRILYILFAIILVVLALFYFVGYTNPVGEYNEPKYTETLIYLIYGMTAVAFIMFLVGKFTHLLSLLKNEPKVGLRFLAFDVLLILLLVVCWAIASSNSVVLTDGTVYDDASMLKLSDMMMYAMYILLAIASIGLLLNLSGIYKKFK